MPNNDDDDVTNRVVSNIDLYSNQQEVSLEKLPG